MTEDKLIAGKVTFDDKVIEKIIARVLEETPGVIAAKGNFVSDLAQRFSNSNKEVSTDGINVEVGQEQVAVDLDIIIEYDQDVPEIAEKISQLAYDEIKLATGLDVIEVNVNVADIMSKEVSTDGINVEVGQEQVAVDLDIIIEYDQDVPEIAEKISQLAYDEIKLATGLDVIEVNVNVADIMSKEEYAKQQAAPKE